MKLAWIACSLFALAAAPRTADADILSLYGHVQVGGGSGIGVSGEAKDDAFHEGARGWSYGVVAGVEVALLDVWVEHNQFRDTEKLVGTWTQLMVGIDADIPIGKGRIVVSDDGKRKRTRPTAYAELGLAVGVGAGTGRQIDPPLDNSEITDKGVIGQVSLGFGYRFTRVMSIGFRLPVQYSYLLKNGVANDVSNHYQSVQVAGMVNFRLDFKLK